MIKLFTLFDFHQAMIRRITISAPNGHPLEADFNSLTHPIQHLLQSELKLPCDLADTIHIILTSENESTVCKRMTKDSLVVYTWVDIIDQADNC